MEELIARLEQLSIEKGEFPVACLTNGCCMGIHWFNTKSLAEAFGQGVAEGGSYFGDSACGATIAMLKDPESEWEAEEVEEILAHLES